MNARKPARRRVTAAVLFLITLAAAFLLTGCGENSSLPDLSGMGNVTAVVREEGSGTKEQFRQLVDTDENGAATTAASTNDVLDTVAKDKNAIGYAAFSEAKGRDDVKILKIDGVSASNETIRSGKYPLKRNYYLAYTGSLNGVEQDFIHYVRSRGQDIVKGYCLPAYKSGTFLSDKSSGTIRIEGSTSMESMMKDLKAGYQSQNPNAKIRITATDSGSGLTAAMQKKCDLAMSSRDLKDYEKELLTTVTVAKDAIVVVVNPDNPLTDLSKDQVKDLFDGKYSKWEELK
jgi:phosphate transport system substrate-binding protein